MLGEKTVAWKDLKRSEQRWFKKIGKVLGVDPKTLPNMRWSEFSQLLKSKGLDWYFRPIKPKA